jgi:hypothetical protein
VVRVNRHRTAPHSSTSKWLQLIHRSVAGSISVATASRTSGNMHRIPVWNSSGSSSLTMSARIIGTIVN